MHHIPRRRRCRDECNRGVRPQDARRARALGAARQSDRPVRADGDLICAGRVQLIDARTLAAIPGLTIAIAKQCPSNGNLYSGAEFCQCRFSAPQPAVATTTRSSRGCSMREIANRGPRLRRLLVLSVIAQGCSRMCQRAISSTAVFSHNRQQPDGGDRIPFSPII